MSQGEYSGWRWKGEYSGWRWAVGGRRVVTVHHGISIHDTIILLHRENSGWRWEGEYRGWVGGWHSASDIKLLYREVFDQVPVVDESEYTRWRWEGEYSGWRWVGWGGRWLHCIMASAYRWWVRVSTEGGGGKVSTVGGGGWLDIGGWLQCITASAYTTPSYYCIERTVGGGRRVSTEGRWEAGTAHQTPNCCTERHSIRCRPSTSQGE